ncbi:nuclear transport factor 2 family protein [Actinoallomurus rhizosphaericola]|uniref:nuclear transport factor 2 family protein n=1 Tax=Actinoallomurus rhizosphaericola TaxID=2952536 RepID=UPI002090F22B|nr:nuclear transport factor 2 family protein [Actinoallomurus rhizosphaericola]MCO5991939.1 nuclear transport factor 2 family protein [Actinoallomurus rhizosphaericola]
MTPHDDRAAITDLLFAYNVAVDALDIDGWAECFTPDGVFHGAYDTFRAVEDKERFAAHARELESTGMPRLRHFLSNIRIDVDGDEARAHCFFQIVATRSAGESSIVMVGEYADHLRRIGDRWLFVERRVLTDGADSIGDGRSAGAAA